VRACQKDNRELPSALRARGRGRSPARAGGGSGTPSDPANDPEWLGEHLPDRWHVLHPRSQDGQPQVTRQAPGELEPPPGPPPRRRVPSRRDRTRPVPALAPRWRAALRPPDRSRHGAVLRRLPVDRAGRPAGGARARQAVPAPVRQATASRLAPAGDRVACSYQGAVWVLPAGGGPMTRRTAGDGLDRRPRLLPWGARAGAVLRPGLRNLA
jgi:hypothetical protein